MNRQNRKKFEKIALQRAKNNFPRVSSAILHNDGSVTPLMPGTVGRFNHVSVDIGDNYQASSRARSPIAREAEQVHGSLWRSFLCSLKNLLHRNV